MKPNILFFALVLCFQLFAKNDHSNLTISQPVKINLTKSTYPYIKLKYSCVNTRNIGVKYELKVPMNYSSIASFGKKSVYNRFQKVQYSSRFQNLEKIDLNAIVQNNKVYTLSKYNSMSFRSL